MRTVYTPHYANASESSAEAGRLRVWLRALFAQRKGYEGVADEPARTSARQAAVEAMARVAEQYSPPGG